jgi:hypothetical protein
MSPLNGTVVRKLRTPKVRSGATADPQRRRTARNSLCCFVPIIASVLLFSSPGQAAEPAAPARLSAADYPSLQAAADALPATGGLLVIPPGNYELKEPLVIKTPETRIEGSGAATHLINRNEAGQPAVILRPADVKQNPKSKLWRVQMADLRISGNKKSGDGLFAENIEEIYLDGVSIDHHGGDGIHLKNCYEDPRITACILTYNAAVGLNIEACHDIVVSANQFEENQDALRCVDSFNLCMTGNNLDDHLRHGVVIENTYGSVVSGNMIEECNGTAVILDRDCYGIAISANVIAHHLEGGVDLRDAWGCTVSANNFVLAHKFGVRVAGEGGRHAITGNSFTNSFIGGGKDMRPATGKTAMAIDAGEGVVIDGGSDVTITGNSFSGLSSEGIRASDSSKRLIISSNVLTDCGRKLPGGAAVIQTGKASEVIERDNLK